MTSHLISSVNVLEKELKSIEKMSILVSDKMAIFVGSVLVRSWETSKKIAIFQSWATPRRGKMDLGKPFHSWTFFLFRCKWQKILKAVICTKNDFIRLTYIKEQIIFSWKSRKDTTKRDIFIFTSHCLSYWSGGFKVVANADELVNAGGLTYFYIFLNLSCGWHLLYISF